MDVIQLGQLLPTLLTGIPESASIHNSWPFDTKPSELWRLKAVLPVVTQFAGWFISWKIPKIHDLGVPPWLRKSPIYHLWGHLELSSATVSTVQGGNSSGPCLRRFTPLRIGLNWSSSASLKVACFRFSTGINLRICSATLTQRSQERPRAQARLHGFTMVSSFHSTAWYAKCPVAIPKISLHLTWFRYLWRKKGCEIQLSSPSYLVSQTQFSHQFLSQLSVNPQPNESQAQ